MTNEGLLEKIDLHEFYEKEINFKNTLEINSKIDETESLVLFPESYKGIMTDREARLERIGGEVLCYIW